MTPLKIVLLLLRVPFFLLFLFFSILLSLFYLHVLALHSHFCSYYLWSCSLESGLEEEAGVLISLYAMEENKQNPLELEGTGYIQKWGI